MIKIRLVYNSGNTEEKEYDGSIEGAAGEFLSLDVKEGSCIAIDVLDVVPEEFFGGLWYISRVFLALDKGKVKNTLYYNVLCKRKRLNNSEDQANELEMTHGFMHLS